MKKIFTLIAAGALMVGASFAQRTVDLSIESLVSPTVLNSTGSGTPIPINFILKNNGPDMVMTGDSIWWNMTITNSAGTQLVTAYPDTDPSIYSIKVLTKDLASGDTIHVLAPNLGSPGGVAQSANIKFIVRAHFISRPDLTFEPTGTITNNVVVEDLVWYNAAGEGVGIDEKFADNMLRIYPNPAKDKVTIENNFIDMSEVSKLNIYDLSGRLVYSATETVLGSSFEVNTSDFKNGVYIVEVASGDIISKSKIVVAH